MEKGSAHLYAVVLFSLPYPSFLKPWLTVIIEQFENLNLASEERLLVLLFSEGG